MEPKFVSVPVAARSIGYSVSTLKKLIDQGKVRVYRLSATSHPRVKLAEVEALLREVPALPAGPVDLDALLAALDEKHGLTHRSRARLH
jgi:hypothetical protein